MTPTVGADLKGIADERRIQLQSRIDRTILEGRRQPQGIAE
jgi:hypothetical protein